MSVIYPTYAGIPQPTMQYCASKIQAAQTAFQTLVIAIAAENVALGITSSGKTKLIADALQPVMYYGTTGSLWEAYNALQHVQVEPEMAPYLTQDKLNWMKNQLLKAIAGL